MAKIVLGIGTSHSPTLSSRRTCCRRTRSVTGRSDAVCTPDGKVRTYEELLEMADPSISELVNDKLFREHHATIQRDIAELARTLEEARPGHGDHRR